MIHYEGTDYPLLVLFPSLLCPSRTSQSCANWGQMSRAQQEECRSGWAFFLWGREDDQSTIRVSFWGMLPRSWYLLWRKHPLIFYQLFIFFFFSPNGFFKGPFYTFASWCNQDGRTLSPLLSPISFYSLDRNTKTTTLEASTRERDGRYNWYRINSRYMREGAKNHIACPGHKEQGGKRKSWKGAFSSSAAKTRCHHSNTAFKKVQPILSSFRWQIIGPRWDTDWWITEEKKLPVLWTTANLNW